MLELVQHLGHQWLSERPRDELLLELEPAVLPARKQIHGAAPTGRPVVAHAGCDRLRLA